MKTPPLRRSLGFWLGLLPAVFLIWVWVDSQRHGYSWWRSSGPLLLRSHSVGVSKSEITFRQREIFIEHSGSMSSSFSPTGAWGEFQRFPVKIGGGQRGSWFPAPRDLKTTQRISEPGSPEIVERFETRGFAVPLWLVLLIYLVAWIGLFAWWRRRQRNRGYHG